MVHAAFFLGLCLFASSTLAQRNPQGGVQSMQVSVGSSDSAIVTVTAGPDIAPAPLSVRFEQGIGFRLSDTTTRILLADETIDYVVIFSPPHVGLFVDEIIFSYTNAQGAVMEIRVPLTGEGISLTVDRSAESAIYVWPNPATDLVNFSDIVSAARIVDIFGREVKRGSEVSKLEISDLPAGRYFVKADADIMTLVVR